MWLGAHVGISEGLPEAVSSARGIGCEAIQIFSKSPQMWKGPPIAGDAAEAFRGAMKREGLRSSAVHHGYLINLATPKRPMLELSRRTFVDELQRAELLGVEHLIFHPGAHLGSGAAAGLVALGESLNWAFDQTPGLRVKALLENAAGQGTAMCATFAELGEALRRVTDRSRVGVTLDTCHLFANGIDFRTPEGYGAMIDEVEREVGTKEVRAFHLNDAKADLGSHLDRHENIGKGFIGAEGFRPLLNDARWTDRAGYLETPLAEGEKGYATYATDLAALRALLEVPAARGKAVVGPTGRRRPARTN
ncbi:MAG: deoxyribonuclease IV [Thermoplasmata archaeon]|nr:deoxyribonuclease IV [Thermoplasmata archaeon]